MELNFPLLLSSTNSLIPCHHFLKTLAYRVQCLIHFRYTLIILSLSFQMNAINDIVLDLKTRQCSKPPQTLNTVQIGPTIPPSSASNPNERSASKSLRKIVFAKLVIFSPGHNCVESQK